MIYQGNIGEKKKNLLKMIDNIVSYVSPNSETMRFEFHDLLYKKKKCCPEKTILGSQPRDKAAEEFTWKWSFVPKGERCFCS